MAGSGDLLVKLLLNSSGFDNGIKKSKKQVSDFEKAGQEMGKKLVTSFGQIAGAMMAIKGAGDAFKAVINSSQTIGDAFASTMSTAKTVTDNFIYALANADFSTFNNGLDDMISKAREAYSAMDQLGNTRMSVDFLQATSGSEYKKAMANARNKSLSVDERRQWLAVADKEMANLMEGQQTIARDSTEAIRTQLAAKTGLSKYFISGDAVKNALLIDSRSTNVQERQQLQKDFNDFNARIAEIRREAESRAIITTTSSMGGTVTTKSKDYDKIMAQAEGEIEKLKRQNADMLVSYEILFRETDSGLQELYNTAKSAIAAQNQISEMMTSRNEVAMQIENEAAAIAQSTAKLREERIKYQEEKQALAEAVNGNVNNSDPIAGVAPATPSFAGTQLGVHKEEFSKPSGAGDLPKSVAMLDESTLPAISFGSNEQTNQFVSNMGSMQDAAGKLQAVLSGVGDVLRNDTTEAKSFGEVAFSLASAILPTIMSAVAGPVGGALTSSLLGALPSIVPFADGGIVTSATLGVFGEAGPEAVMPLDRLNDFVRDREVRVTGKIVGSGKDLNVIIDNYNKVRAVK